MNLKEIEDHEIYSDLQNINDVEIGTTHLLHPSPQSFRRNNSPLQVDLKYVSARAGAGKTHAFAKVAVQRSKVGKNTVIIVPTIALLRGIVGAVQEQGHDCRIVVFHSEDGSEGAVQPRVVKYLRDEWSPGDILVITHPCFLNLPFFPGKANWRLLVDENIPTFNSITLNLHDNHHLITHHLTTGAGGSTYAKVIVQNKTELKRIVDNKNNDDVWERLWPACSLLLAEDCDCYVDHKQLNDLKNSLKPKGQLTIYAFRKPDRFVGFDGVAFASASFEDSFTFHYWQSLGVEWSQDDEVMGSLLRPFHPYNDRLTIYYGYEGRNSKHRRNRLEKEGNDDLREEAIRLMGDEPFLWLENNDRADTSILRRCEKGKCLPPVSAGLNDYIDYRHGIILAATNYKPGEASILERVGGFGPEQQARAMVDNIYQALMRTKLRKDEIEEETRWVVACEEEAKLLSQRFPGSVVKRLGLKQIEKRKAGRPRKHDTDNDRKRLYDRKKKGSSSLREGFAHYIAHTIVQNVVFLDKQDETTYKSIGDIVRYFRGSYFTCMTDNRPQVIYRSEDDFIKLLYEMSSHIYSQKDDIPAITGALFDPRVNNGGIRDKDKVLATRGMWLDFEGGDLTVTDFEQAFPQLQFIAYSTFRHTREDPRFRIYIPTSRAMIEEESVAIYQEIRYTLKTQGWKQGSRAKSKRGVSLNDRFDGIDNRSGPSQLSLLPCQSQDQKSSFFIDRTDDRKSLNVDEWLKQKLWLDADDDFYDLPVPHDGPNDEELSQEQKTIIDQAQHLWDTHGRLRGNGNEGIFLLSLALRKARLSITEIEVRLYEAAEKASSPGERKAQVRRIIKNIRNKAR